MSIGTYFHWLGKPQHQLALTRRYRISAHTDAVKLQLTRIVSCSEHCVESSKIGEVQRRVPATSENWMENNGSDRAAGYYYYVGLSGQLTAFGRGIGAVLS